MVTTIRCDDDFADRLNFRYTVAALVVFAILVTSKQYVGEPIDCWAPAHFSKPHVAYAKDYCWIRNTYYLPMEEEIPKDGQPDQVEQDLAKHGGHEIMYYQWVPIVLLIQAFFFWAPSAIWQSFGDNSGIDVGNLISEGQLLASVQMEEEVRQKIIKKMVRQVDRYLSAYNGSKNSTHSSWTVSIKHLVSRTCCVSCSRERSSYLVTLYLIVKALYVINVILQLFALDAFLGTAYHTYGIDVLRAVANGEDWTASPRFPRITMCNMKVRRLGNVHRYTLQCVLPINLFNEKIYLLLWFWLVFVAIVTCITAVSWLVRIFSRRRRRLYIRRYLNLAGRVDPNYSRDQGKMVHFIDKYMRQDGTFLVRVMTAAANGLTAMELTAGLWDYYWKTHPELKSPAHPDLEQDKATLPLNGYRRTGVFEPKAATDFVNPPPLPSAPDELDTIIADPINEKNNNGNLTNLG
jgi:hypothetical protein